MNGVRLLYRESKTAVWAFSCLCAIPLLPEYCAPVLAILSLVFAVLDARDRGKTVQIGDVGKILLLYIAYLAVTILFSSHKLNSLATVGMWAVMFCGYLTVSTVAISRRRIRIFLLLFSIAAGAVGGIACLQYLLRDLCHLSLPNQIWLSIDTWFYRLFPMEVDILIAPHRAASTFNNPNVMSEFLIMAIPFATLCGFDGSRTRTKLTARFGLLLAIIGMAVSFSRGAYLAALSMILLILVTNLRRITPLILSLIAAVSLIPEAVISRFLSISDTAEFSVAHRFETWDLAIRAVLESPLVGLGCGVLPFGEYARSLGVNVPHAHNLVLQVLAEGGFIALFILAWAAIKLLQNSMDLLAHSPKTHLCGVCILAFGVAFVVYGMVDYPFLCPKLVGTFLTVIGFADAVMAQYLKKSSIPFSQLLNRKS